MNHLIMFLERENKTKLITSYFLKLLWEKIDLSLKSVIGITVYLLCSRKKVVYLLSVFYKLFCLRFFISSDQWENALQQRFHNKSEGDFYLKTILTLIPINLVTNSLLYLFCSFVKTKNKNETSSKLVLW